jgi:hypothetical protein
LEQNRKDRQVILKMTARRDMQLCYDPAPHAAGANQNHVGGAFGKGFLEGLDPIVSPANAVPILRYSGAGGPQTLDNARGNSPVGPGIAQKDTGRRYLDLGALGVPCRGQFRNHVTNGSCASLKIAGAFHHSE